MIKHFTLKMASNLQSFIRFAKATHVQGQTMGAQFVPQMPSLKRRLELIKGDISQNTALLEPHCESSVRPCENTILK